MNEALAKIQACEEIIHVGISSNPVKGKNNKCTHYDPLGGIPNWCFLKLVVSNTTNVLQAIPNSLGKVFPKRIPPTYCTGYVF